MLLSHLVVNGCSWTYCQGLEKPNLHGWPALVAEEFNLPVVNLASPGSGNDAIHRRTYEYVLEDSININNPLYIIAWSQSWRREAWCKKIYNNTYKYDGYNIISFPHGNKASNNLEYALLDTWSEEDFYRKTILYRLSIDSLFKSRNIKYFSSFFSDGNFNFKNFKNDNSDILSNVDTRFSQTVKYLETATNKIEDFVKISRPYPKTKCGHEGIEGNKAIADYLIQKIKTSLPTIEIVSQNYLSLNDYLKKTDLNPPSFTDWL